MFPYLRTSDVHPTIPDSIPQSILDLILSHAYPYAHSRHWDVYQKGGNSNSILETHTIVYTLWPIFGPTTLATLFRTSVRTPFSPPLEFSRSFSDTRRTSAHLRSHRPWLFNIRILSFPATDSIWFIWHVTKNRLSFGLLSVLRLTSDSITFHSATYRYSDSVTNPLPSPYTYATISVVQFVSFEM